jgi:hypothetical protein
VVMAGGVLSGCSGSSISASVKPDRKSPSMEAGVWNREVPATSPVARRSESMTGDTATGDVVLFGGQGLGTSTRSDLSTALSDTWTWDGHAWTEQHPTISPPARWFASMAFDPVSRSVILFGGQDATSTFSDTWAWNGMTWTEPQPADNPEARVLAVMAESPGGKGDVLSGGYGGGTRFHDTWQWNGLDWIQLHPRSYPPCLNGSSLALDEVAGNDVMLGGAGPGCTLMDSNTTWLWNGTTWVNQQSGTRPKGRMSAALSSLGPTGGVLLFGGLTLGGPLGPHSDTWLGRSASWRQVKVSAGPPGRELASMAYDQENGSVVLFGGQNAYSGKWYSDTWIFQPS